MKFELEGKVALVTGGGRGIGRAVALMLAGHGVNVALCGRTEQTLEETAGQIRALGVQAWPIVTDVADPDALKGFIDSAATQAGRVDILVNNAVSSLHAPFAEQTDDHWRHHIDVKLMACIRASRLIIPHMRTVGGGRIVNIGGMTARIVAPIRITNGVVNAGISNFTKQLSAQVGVDNITVNCVHPGFTATDRMMAGVRRRATDSGIGEADEIARMVGSIPLGRLVAPEDIARAVLFFCSPLAAMVTGQSIAVDGGSGESINY
ncbi:MAG: SDR family oxidoreductase [Gammaproteobacteria bacterium]|nr:SDR family oxidoreductase [Gammaproteobacteria bacterium]